jgi:glycosyltransferase involved in cell wall biosynthesis
VLDIVGEGSSQDELRALARDLSLDGQVTWHGQLSQEQLARLYGAATAVVVPSTDEGLGLVAVEALLCETPVVGFRSGGLTDVIRDNSTGILVDPGDFSALARALDAVIADPARASTLGKAGRIHALSTFAPESVARRYAAVYHKVLAAQAG